MAVSFAAQVLRGKTLGRVIFNAEVSRRCADLSGRVLDLAGGGSYEALLPNGIEILVTNLDPALGPVVDFDEPLPYDDGSFEHVLLFQALYIAANPIATLQEIRRVLRPGGTAFIASPFLQNEMREPHDYARYTSEGLERLFMSSGFERFGIEPYGERFSVALNLLHPFFLFGIVRLPWYALARALDRLVPTKLRRKHPAPLGWFCTLYKP